MNWIKKLFLRKTKASKTEEQKYKDRLEKEKSTATKNHEPWVGILSMDVDIENINSGSFELDWNEFFITRLIKAGYQGKTDADLIDQWFNNVCRNVVLETYEQEAADRHPVKSRKLDDGRREYN